MVRAGIKHLPFSPDRRVMLYGWPPPNLVQTVLVPQGPGLSDLSRVLVCVRGPRGGGGA